MSLLLLHIINTYNMSTNTFTPHKIVNFYGDSKTAKNVFNEMCSLPLNKFIVTGDDLNKLYSLPTNVSYVFIDLTECDDNLKYITPIAESINKNEESSATFYVFSSSRVYAFVSGFFENTVFYEVQ